MPRGASSGADVVSDTMTTGACWPWNLSTVPMRTPGSRSASAVTCALYGATIMRSRARQRRFFAVGVAIANAVGRQRRDERRDRVDFLERARLVRVVLDGHVDEPRARRASRRPSRPAPARPAARARRRRQPALVERLGRERADRRDAGGVFGAGTGRGRSRWSLRRRADARAPTRPRPADGSLAAAARAAAGRRAARGSWRRPRRRARRRATSARPRR